MSSVQWISNTDSISKTREVYNASQRRAPIGRWVKIKADIKYPFEHGEVINYTLDGASIHLVTKKMHVSFLTQLVDTKETAQEFQHEVNGDFDSYSLINGCYMRKLRMDQQHCSYSTILT